MRRNDKDVAGISLLLQDQSWLRNQLLITLLRVILKFLRSLMQNRANLDGS
jgi:hypothetical protein